MTSLLPFSSGGLVPFGAGREARAMARIRDRVQAEVELETHVRVLRELARGEVANVSLIESGAVSAMEFSLAQSFPNGASRYRAIADAHAAGAAASLLRFK